MKVPRHRHELLELELLHLAPWATPSRDAIRQRPEEPGGDSRLPFQRDRDRIVHSRSFRRLKHKTQVFVPHLADHPRTRLTHTLEVTQIARSMARSLGLNEDLTEAIALGHDLGHTAFGHIGEKVLDEILSGKSDILPPQVAAAIGRFKHNYQSLRVVDRLERRDLEGGLNLCDQVREGIIKHTGCRADYPFPLDHKDSLRLGEPCHLEGQVVALADEIAQQTHDLEDGLRAGSIRLERVEALEVAKHLIAGIDGYTESPRWYRQQLMIRGLLARFAEDALSDSSTRLEALADSAFARVSTDRIGLQAATLRLSPAVTTELAELKAFIYRFVINHPQVNRQDWRARKVVSGLFRAFWVNPLNLPTYVLLRARDELGFPYLRDFALSAVPGEITSRYQTSPGFARLIADHIAGMSDRFALEEYQSLEEPSPDQRLLPDLS